MKTTYSNPIQERFEKLKFRFEEKFDALFKVLTLSNISWKFEPMQDHATCTVKLIFWTRNFRGAVSIIYKINESDRIVWKFLSQKNTWWKFEQPRFYGEHDIDLLAQSILRNIITPYLRWLNNW